LYSCDQTVSQVQELQSKTLASHEEKSLPYYKRRNISVMILACPSTSSGNLKTKNRFCGQSGKPNALQNMISAALLVCI